MVDEACFYSQHLITSINIPLMLVEAIECGIQQIITAVYKRRLVG